MNHHILVFPLVFILTLALEDFKSESCYEKPLFSPKECFGNFTTWSYMNETNTCEKFIYTGCMGNANRFDSEEECIEMCVERSNTEDESDDGP
ncbi:male accessory gland serine protease inhibitor-like [Lucilia sericata]|uniref:male accessory gland serine protease inhibitor-like n=1 Tax=Lucilia sericata TaxID=13632 RepID=UPI0018A7E851|nr:male accessory gland serine protease inhibitor-like [Lucilia sericata]